jgi:hypothetical protein
LDPAWLLVRDHRRARVGKPIDVGRGHIRLRIGGRESGPEPGGQLLGSLGLFGMVAHGFSGPAIAQNNDSLLSENQIP